MRQEWREFMQMGRPFAGPRGVPRAGIGRLLLTAILALAFLLILVLGMSLLNEVSEPEDGGVVTRSDGPASQPPTDRIGLYSVSGIFVLLGIALSYYLAGWLINAWTRAIKALRRQF